MCHDLLLPGTEHNSVPRGPGESGGAILSREVGRVGHGRMVRRRARSGDEPANRLTSLHWPAHS